MLSAQSLKQLTGTVIARAVLRTPEEDGDTEEHLVPGTGLASSANPHRHSLRLRFYYKNQNK